MAYFDCNLPSKAPAYIRKEKAEEMTKTFATIRARMEKLEEALDISGLHPATFAEYAKVLFDSSFERFDEMTPDELAEYACLVHKDGYQAKERMEWPNATVLVDTAFLNKERKEWEMIRHLGIGGSDAAVVQNASPYNTPYVLYHDKCWTHDAKADDGKQAVFDRGHFMENKVIRAFCDLTGAEVVPESRMFQSKKYPAAIADIDAVIRMPNGNVYVFEAKTTVAGNYAAWMGNQVPSHYIPQTRQYPAVLDDDRVLGTYIGCLFTVDYAVHGLYIGSDTDVGKFLSRLIERDKEKEDFFLGLEQSFYDDHLMAQKEPEFSGDPEVNKAAITALVGKTTDPEAAPIDVPETMLEDVRAYLALKDESAKLDAQKKNIKEAADTLALPFIAMLGEKVEARLPVPDSEDGEYYEVKYVPRSGTDVDLQTLEAFFPDAYDKCVKVNPCKSRTFSIKVKKPKPNKKQQSA